MPGSRAKKSRSEPGTAPITPELEAWLAAFAESNERIPACKAAGITWKTVQEALAGSAAFRARYDEIMAEREVAIIDQYAKAGQGGNAAAGKAYLAAVGSRFARAGEDEDEPGVAPGDARAYCRKLFGEAEGAVN